MGKTRLDLGLLLALLVTFNLAAQGTSAPSSLSKPLPRALENSLSPLSAEQQLYYSKLIKGAAILQPMNKSPFYDFCTEARLLCGSLLQRSKWGARAGGAAESVLPSFDTTAAFSGWASRTENPNASVAKAEEVRQEQTDTDIGNPSRDSATAEKPEGGKQYLRETDFAIGAQLVLPSFIYEPASRGESNAELKPSFLPASMALALPPFDMQHLTDLLKLFRIPFNSELAKKMEETLKACTESTQEGLGKKKKKKKDDDDDDDSVISSCVTSIEALIKFVLSMLKAPEKDIQALTNSEIVGSEGDMVTILQMTELAAGHDAVDCHDLVFPFKVMGCHRIKQSKAMVVKVQAEEGGKDMDLLVACHQNTTLFNPYHEAFVQLQSSPGHTEICHFLPNGDTMWVPL